MKNCNEMVNSLLERRNQYYIDQKKKRKALVCTLTPMCCVCLIAVIGIGMWRSGMFSTTPSDQMKDDDVYAGGSEDSDDEVIFAGDYWVPEGGNNDNSQESASTSAITDDEPEDSTSSSNDVMIPYGMVIIDGVTYVEYDSGDKSYTPDTYLGSTYDFNGTYHALNIGGKFFTTKEDPDILIAIIENDRVTLIKEK